MTSSMAVQRIIDDQQEVARFEVGEIDLNELLSGLPFVDWPRRGLVEDLAFFHGWFRPVEAAAYKYRGENNVLVQEKVAVCRQLKPQVEAALSRVAELPESSGLEELGKFAAVEKLRWALRLLDQFTVWGY